MSRQSHICFSRLLISVVNDNFFPFIKVKFGIDLRQFFCDIRNPFRMLKRHLNLSLGCRHIAFKLFQFLQCSRFALRKLLHHTFKTRDVPMCRLTCRHLILSCTCNRQRPFDSQHNHRIKADLETAIFCQSYVGFAGLQCIK